MAVTNARPTYGHWVRPRSPGIGPLGMLPSAGLFTGLVIGLLAFQTLGVLAAAVVAVGTAAGVAVTVRPGGGRSVGETLVGRGGWWLSRAGTRTYRSGPLTTHSRTHRLPGILAATTVLPGRDGRGRDLAVVARRPSGLYTLVFRCRADGETLADPAVVDTWVAQWGTFLSSLAHEPGLVAAAVVVDTAPDPGTRLAAEVEGNADPDAPALAKAVMAEVVETYPAASSENTAYLTVTYSGVGISRRSRSVADIVTEASRRAPGLSTGLAASGAGTVEPMTATELAAVVRVAYDPAGNPVETRPSWDDAGPTAAEESWASYRHDSGISATWSMTLPPSGAVPSDVLSPLLAPHPDFVRKRVAMLYRPHTPSTAAAIAERDVQTAAFTATGGRGRVTAAATQRMRATERSAAEVAQGAGVTRFALLVTVTVADAAELPQAATTAENLASTARLRLRRCYGSQAAAFAATLPVGFVPWRHTTVPASLRDLL